MNERIDRFLYGMGIDRFKGSGFERVHRKGKGEVPTRIRGFPRELNQRGKAGHLLQAWGMKLGTL